MDSRRKCHKLLLLLAVPLLFGLSAIRSGVGCQSGERTSSAVARLEEASGMEEELGPTYPDGARRFRRLQLQDEKGLIPVDGLEKARRHVTLMKAAQQERKKAQLKRALSPQAAGIRPDSWTWLGPGNVGGRIRSIVIHPTNPNTMWVGSVSGGIWRTNNGGASWFPVDDFLANLAVSTMVINSTNPNIMYAGTGEGFGYSSQGTFSGLYQGAGVFRSNDGGVTWSQLASTSPAVTPPPGCGVVGATPCPQFWFYVNRLEISPNGSTISAATNGGVAQSTDGGATWTQRTTTSAVDIDFRSDTLGIVGELGVARFTTNGGLTWTAATFVPPITTGGTAATNARVELAYAPSQNNFVYAAVNQNNGEIYVSNDGGERYTRSNTGANLFLGGAGSQGWYDNIIWVNPVDPDFVIVGGVNLWRSTDTGTTFTRISDGSTNSAHPDHHMIVAHPGFNNNTNRIVYFGNDGGIYRTDNIATVADTSGWVELNNRLGITQFYGAAGNATSGVIIGGTQDNGTVRFNGGTSDPDSWTMPLGSDGGYCAADPTDPNFFYGESQNMVIYRSTSAGGPPYSNISGGITDSNNCTPAGVCNANFIAPFILDPNDPNSMLGGGLSLWRSTDVKAATPTWSQIKTPIGANSAGCPLCISAIAVSPVGSNIICVGHNNGNIYLTLNGTANSPTWTQINTPTPPPHFVTRMVIDASRSPSWIYATFGGFTPDNVFRSTDLGTTWTDITGTGLTGLPNVPVRSLVFHPNNPNLLYVGTEIGIFTSSDAGATWEVPQDGPANVSVDELFWMGNDLIAATHGRGLYRASGGIYVDCHYTGVEHGTFNEPYRTITAAINATTRFQTIWIKPCNYNEAIITNKRLELRSLGGTAAIGRP